jgi:hypothetical protein
MSEEAVSNPLREQADKLGIKYSPNIGDATLQERVNQAIQEKAAEPKKVSSKETEGSKKARKRKEANRLVRVRVTCFDPTMKKKAGTYIMGSNSTVGTIRKFIQFNKPWFMPQLLVNIMRESMYQAWIPGKTKYGITQMISSIEPRYNVVDMPAMSTKEITDLRTQQALADNLGD